MTDRISLNNYPKAMKVFFRKDGENDDYIVFKTPYDGAIAIINPVGARVFELSDGEHTVEEISNCILDEFDAPNIKQVQNDIVNLLNYLIDCGVIIMLSN